MITIIKVGLLISLTSVVFGMDVAVKNDVATQLIEAVKNNRQDVVEQLLKSRGNINADDQEGRSALHWAAESGNVAMVNCY